MNNNNTPTYERNLNGGSQRVFRFANGYGASVVCHKYSYGGSSGLFELAVLKYTGPDNHDWTLCYDTPITEDVIGHLTEEEVQEILKDIEKLPVLPSEGVKTIVNGD